MAAPTFDLQSHSTHSDGSLPAADAVGLRLVAAAELSALDGDREDLHVLGYGLDHRDPALLHALERFRADRAARAARMADAMRDLGWVVELPDRGDRPVGRPHVAQAVFAHPANRMRLEREGLVNFSQVLEAYLVPGRPGYRRRETPTVAEAIAVIHAADGVAVWAHPFWDLDHDAEVLDAVERFAGLGMDGIEAFYVTHTAVQARLVARRCAELGLLTTGSADFHGPEHPLFNAFRAFELHGCTPHLGPIA
jgi:predicted metal-dependent phosphoesterase TrpH